MQMDRELKMYYCKRISVTGEVAEELNASSALKITCPNPECGCSMIVKLTWIKGRFRSRPCTYCFKSALIPYELPPRKKK